MNYIVPDIDFRTARDACIKHGFGIVEAKDESGATKQADIWTSNDYHQDGTGEIGGFRIGTIAQSLGAFDSMSRLELTDFNCGTDAKRRLADLFSTLIHRTTIR